ncbi:MAG: hypothetical protein HY075_10795 [Deltaproteobacteria bacterium]|nr:hypothetical protein [Deltaproteobacteria bacterium]
MRRLPASPSRSQALIELEPILAEKFSAFTTRTHAEVRDSMHYALFSKPDRFCVSAAWLVAPRLGIATARFAPVACAIEVLRCALTKKHSERFAEPVLAEAASYGLLSLSFEMILSCDDATLSVTERCAIARALAHASAPANQLAMLHRESRLAREARGMDRASLQTLQQDRISPAYEATGHALAILAGREALAPWFKRLGLLTRWVEEFASDSRSALALKNLMSGPDAMDMIKSLEAELIERASELGIRDAAHDVLEPLGDALKARLQ